MESRLKIFIGVDERQPVAYSVLRASIEFQASAPVDIAPLRIDWSPMKRVGLTTFTFTRYLVPWICNYEGSALFLDADMLCNGDIHELARLAESQDAGVSVVKNPRRFEWSSVMYFQNAKCQRLTPELIQTGTPQNLAWSDSIGELPSEWNFLVSYDPPMANPKLIHYSAGIPIWPETKNCEHADLWHAAHRFTNSSVSFEELMGRSVHVPHLEKLKVGA